MRAYQFVQRCRSRNDLRAADVAQFLQLMGEAFDVDFWIYRGEKVDTDEAAIERQLQSLIDPQIPGAGASWILSSHHVENPIIAITTTGADEWGRDFFDIDFSRCELLPDLSYFRRSIEVCRPFEACITDNQNEVDLDAQERQRRFPNFEGPAILRWYHYMDEPLVEALGGFDHCLRTPAFKVERFCEGVLFQLTEEPFEACNTLHKDYQLRAMRHLGLV